jgi:putative spermidine/putrescine transport system substrate-binding protein
MTERTVSRRRFIKSIGIATGSALAGPLVIRRATATTQIVEVGWGGDYQFKHLNQAFVVPFTKETGIKVLQVASPGNMVGTIKAQVENKNPEWDVVAVTTPEGLLLKKQGLISDLTYEEEVRADFPPALLDRHLGPRTLTTNVLAWNTKHFASDRQPKTWADLWDVTRFPGPRTLPAWFPWVNVEMATMAAGVPKDQVYPLTDEKVRRALDKLKEVRPQVHVWYNAGAQSVQLFADGEVVLGMIYENRVREAVKRNVPIGWTLDGGITELGYYVVPASSRNKEAANKFINIAMRRRSQAELVRTNQYGATNPKAYDLLSPAEKESNLGYAPNLARQLRLDAAYWLEAGPRYTDAWDNLKAGK